jgi:hypothetical protein
MSARAGWRPGKWEWDIALFGADPDEKVAG